MPREIWTQSVAIETLSTSWQDVIPTVPTGEVLVARVRYANYGSQRVLITAGIWDATSELARVVPSIAIAPGEVLEDYVRVVGGQRLRAYASASAVAVSVSHAVRQY